MNLKWNINWISLYYFKIRIKWNWFKNKYNLKSPRSVVNKLREDGHCVYINKSSTGTSYRIGTPSKAIVAAGLMALEGQAVA